MKLIATPLGCVEDGVADGVVILEPSVFRDDRGFFLETHNQGKLDALGFRPRFVQDNHSKSKRGTLRGLHAQLHRPQGKLVRATAGSIFDVAVDLRLNSPTYRHWFGIELTAENFLQLYIPEGFAHGFFVLSETAEVQYKCTDLYDAEDEISLRWNDEAIGDGGIIWPTSGAEPIVSPRDAQAPSLEELEPKLRDAAAYRVAD